jgi:hypothetical protein
MMQLKIEARRLARVRVRVHLVELFMVGAVGALDMSVQFRRLRDGWPGRNGLKQFRVPTLVF